MAPELKARRCTNHPERPALATCKQCRSSICQECATQWDGINYCVKCVAELRKTDDSRSGALPTLSLLVAVPVLFYVTGRLMVWVLVLISGMVS